MHRTCRYVHTNRLGRDRQTTVETLITNTEAGTLMYMFLVLTVERQINFAGLGNMMLGVKLIKKNT